MAILLAGPGLARAEPVECSVSDGDMSFTPQEEAALRACVQPCDAGVPSACATLADAVLKRPFLYEGSIGGLQISEIAETAARYLERACQAAPRYQALTGRDRNDSKDAAEAFAAGDACLRLGYGYGESRHGFPQDWARATKYFGMACEIDQGEGCDIAAVLHADGRDVPRNYELAIRLGERGCSLAHSTSYISCFAGGIAHSQLGQLERAAELLNTGALRSTCALRSRPISWRRPPSPTGSSASAFAPR